MKKIFQKNNLLQSLHGIAKEKNFTKYPISVFLDSCPDRRGRILMQRREAVLAKKENRTPRNFMTQQGHGGRKMNSFTCRCSVKPFDEVRIILTKSAIILFH